LIGLDTNVLVRLITRDDAVQAERARAILAKNEVWLAKSVILEVEWVLRYSYGFSRIQIGSALNAVLGLPNVLAEDPEQLFQALEWYSSGMDLADALHLAGAGICEEFCTFDQKLIRKAVELKTAVLVSSP
jgi:predicted nucleic-acid-binding protein